MEHKTFLQLQAESRRCAMLRFLSDSPGYEMNTSVMQDALDVYGIPSPAIRWRPMQRGSPNRGLPRLKTLGQSRFSTLRDAGRTSPRAAP